MIAGNSNRWYTNPKKITVRKTSLTIKEGAKVKISGITVTKVKSAKDLLSAAHSKKVRYLSGNKKVATVSKSGVVKGVRAGYCVIYAQTINGMWQKIELTVK